MRSAWRARSSRWGWASTRRTIGRSGSATQPSHVPNDEPAGIDSEPGMCSRAWWRGERASTISAPRPSAASNPSPDNGAISGTTPPSNGGPAWFDRSHPGEVARDGRLAAEQRPCERIDLHRREERVVAALVADRRPRGRRDPGRAERAGAVGRVDHHRLLVAAGGRRAASGTCRRRTAARGPRRAGRSARPRRPAASRRSGAGTARRPATCRPPHS